MKQPKVTSHFEIVENDGFKVLKMNGNLENDSAKTFSESIPSIIGSSAVDIILNFENVSEISGHWLRALLTLHNELKKSNKQMRMIYVSKAVDDFMKREGVNTVLKTQADLRSALAELKLVTKQTLDVNFINPFLNAAIKVLETQASTKVTPGKIYRKEGRGKFIGDISGVIGLVCEAFTGSVVISFPAPTFLKIMSRMLGEECTTMTKDIADGAGELTNMIFGQAKVVLNDKGYGIKTALPSVVTGSDHTILQMSNGPIMVIPFQTDAGDFFIEVCISG